MAANGIVPLRSGEMAKVAPNWSAMKDAIVACDKIDEVRKLSDQAMTLRAYFVQSKDVDNELAAMRIRLRAERRFGELIAQEQKAGTLAGKGTHRGNQHTGNIASDDISKLSDHGITPDRSARAQALARVPAKDFEAALSKGRPSAAKLTKLDPKKSIVPSKPKELKIDIEPVLLTWGEIRDFAAAIDDGRMLDPNGWSKHPGIQKFQIDEIRKAIPTIVTYLSRLALEE